MAVAPLRSDFVFAGGVTAASLATQPGPSSGSPTCYVDEFNAMYKWTLGSVVVVDNFRVIGHTGGSAGRWILDSDGIRLAPSLGHTWATLLAARTAMAYQGSITLAAEAWTFDTAVDAVTSCPSGTHEIWEKGATINGTVALSPGTVAQNGFWYNNGGAAAPIASTTLNGAVAAGAVQVVVTSAVGFAVGVYFRMQRGVAYTRTYRVTAVAGTTITLDRPLRRPFNNLDTVEVILAARDITIEGNGVILTGQADATWQLTSGVNCHFLDIVSRLTTAKFGCCFDLGSRDCTANNVNVDSNGAIATCFLTHNAENVRHYDCVGYNVGGAGTPTVFSYASNDSCHDYAGHYTRGTRAAVLDVEDLTDTFGCRSCTFSGTFFGKATAAGVEVLNSSASNTFYGCESSDNQSGWAFTGGNGPANGNLLVGCSANRNSQVAATANAATINRAVGLSGEGNVVAFVLVAGAADFELVDPFINDTSVAVASQGLVMATGAGSVARIIGGYATSTRAVQHLLELNLGAKGVIDGGTRYVAAGANCAGVLINAGVARLGQFTAETPAGFGVFLNGAAAFARLGDQTNLSGAGTPLSPGAGAFNRGQIALTAAVAVAIAFGDTNATDRLFWSYVTNVGGTGTVFTGAPIVGTGFNVTALAGDTSLINYEIR